jgi:hypothetical protein
MSTTLPSRCANVSLSVRLPQLDCTNNTLGDFGNLSDFGRGLGSIPGQLGGIVDCVAADVRAQIEQSINSLTSTLRPIFAAINTTVPTPLFENLEAPEIELEMRTSSMWQEFKLYWQTTVYDILANIPGLRFITNLVNVPIPFLTGVKLFDVFTPEGRARIRAAVGDRLDAVSSALGLPWDATLDGDLGLNMPEVRKETIIRRIFSEIETMLTNVLASAVRMIQNLEPIKTISKIWRNFGFPSLPDLTSINFEDLFNSIWDGIKDQAISVRDKLQRAMDALLDFDVGDYLKSAFGSILDRIPWPFPTRMRELVSIVTTVTEEGTSTAGNLTIPEWDFSRVIRAVQGVLARLPGMILELFLQLIRPFLEAIEGIVIGITELLEYIPFTMCTFLNLVAAPLLSLGSTISDLLPPGIPLVAAST